MLTWSEGTSTSPATALDGYDVIVTGIDRKPEIFTDFSDHPLRKWTTLEGHQQ
jgi:muramidase (phage lysozyme)